MPKHPTKHQLLQYALTQLLQYVLTQLLQYVLTQLNASTLSFSSGLLFDTRRRQYSDTSYSSEFRKQSEISAR